jgi:hypothetical protein
MDIETDTLAPLLRAVVEVPAWSSPSTLSVLAGPRPLTSAAVHVLAERWAGQGPLEVITIGGATLKVADLDTLATAIALRPDGLRVVAVDGFAGAAAQTVDRLLVFAEHPPADVAVIFCVRSLEDLSATLLGRAERWVTLPAPSLDALRGAAQHSAPTLVPLISAAGDVEVLAVAATELRLVPLLEEVTDASLTQWTGSVGLHQRIAGAREGLSAPAQTVLLQRARGVIAERCRGALRDAHDQAAAERALLLLEVLVSARTLAALSAGCLRLGTPSGTGPSHGAHL